jgi:hypothetical protein
MKYVYVVRELPEDRSSQVALREKFEWARPLLEGRIPGGKVEVTYTDTRSIEIAIETDHEELIAPALQSYLEKANLQVVG